MRTTRLHTLLFTIALVSAIALPVRAADPKRALDKLVDIEKRFDGDLKDILDYLGDRYEIKFAVDQNAFAKEKLEQPNGRKVQLQRMEGVCLDTVLRQLFDQVDAVYEIRGGNFVVLPDRVGNKRRYYPPFALGQPAARKQMEQRIAQLKVTLPKDFKGDLQEMLEFISDNQRVAIIVDVSEFRRIAKIESPQQTKVALPAGTYTVLEAIDRVVGPIKARYEILGDHLRILPQRPES